MKDDKEENYNSGIFSIPHNQSGRYSTMQLNINSYLIIFCLFLGQILILTSCGGDEEEPPMGPNSDIEIRPILEGEFLLLNFDMALLTRSTCDTYRSVTTDEDGIFSLSNYDGRDIVAFAEDPGNNDVYIGTFNASDINNNSVNDIPFRESRFQNVFLEGTGIGEQAIFSTSDNLTASYSIIVPDYPLEKIQLEISDNSGSLLNTASVQADGSVSFDLPITEPGEHSLQLRFIGLGDILVLETFVGYNIVNEFQANFTAVADECNTIVLSWDAYTSDDFNSYLISRAESTDETGNCQQLFNSTFIEDKNTTSLQITDYATTESLCFSIEVQTNSGLSDKKEVMIDNPYGYRSNSIEDISSTTLLSNGTLYFQIASSNQLCNRDPNTNTYSCNTFNLDNQQIIFSGEVNGNFNYITWDGTYRLLNDQNELQGFSNDNSLSPQMFVTKDGHGLAVDALSFERFKVFNFATELVSASNFEIEGNYTAFANAPNPNQFAILSYVDDPITLTIQNKLTLYTITDVNTIVKNQTIDIESPFILEGCSVSPNGRYLSLNNGLVYDLSAETIAAKRILPNNRYEVWATDTHVLLVDQSQGKRFIYDYNTDTITEKELCGGQVKGATNDLGTFVTKFNQVGITADVIY